MPKFEKEIQRNVLAKFDNTKKTNKNLMPIEIFAHIQIIKRRLAKHAHRYPSRIFNNKVSWERPSL